MSLFEVQQISVTRDEKQILNAVSYQAVSGTVLGLIGANGAGKTTLLQASLGLIPVDRGETRLDGAPLASFNAKQVAKRLAYLPQGGELHWPLTVASIVALGRLPHRAPWQSLAEGDEAIISAAMRATDIDQFANRTVSSLSSGERTRAHIARALASEPEFLFADEPIANLDPAHQLDTLRLFRTMAEQGTGIVIVLHDLNLAQQYCDRLILLADGNILGEGSPSQVLSDDNLAQAFGISVHRLQAGPEEFIVPHTRL